MGSSSDERNTGMWIDPHSKRFNAYVFTFTCDMMTYDVRSRRLPSFFLVLMLLGLTTMGCASLSNTEQGAAIGAGAGGAAGAAIGKAAGGTAEGAIIGAVVGGTAGAIIGQRMDQKAEELEDELANAEVERVGEGIKVTFDNAILFDFDSASLRSTARTNLDELAASMEDFEGSELLIVGHTDSKGSDEYNMRLSERRANAATEYLIEQGIRPSRITTVGRGESEPVASNETAEGRQQNRRVEVAIFASEEYREELAQRQSENN
jgi:outer membrane protein OmpA-like peptidoglycan-associated protein